MPLENGSDGTNGTHNDTVSCDVLVVGAGFGGITALYRLRKEGYNVKIFEAGSDFGGVWYWNRYPGARVDSEYPFYQLNIPEVYKTWNFQERFPAQKEIARYAQHLDKTLDLRKDTYFNARVNSTEWDGDTGRWKVKTEAGHTATCKYLLLATGILHKKYTPDFPGLGDFKGEVHHSSFWPEGVETKGKRVAVIGGGATSVQIVQELAKEADHLTVFIRRPSYCLALGNRKVSAEEQNSWKTYYPKLFEDSRNSRVGFPVLGAPKKVSEASDEEREALFEELWDRGGFTYLLGNYNDYSLDETANQVVYDFWRRKVCQRLTDPAKQAIMAPKKQVYHFGTRRSPLETDYYDCLNQGNVEIVSLPTTPIKKFTEKGIMVEDGRHFDLDVVALATGFDTYSGSLTNMGLKDKTGVDIKDIWKDNIESYLGLMIHGFPNLFMVYGPQAPTPFANGPTILECQIDLIFDSINRLEKANAKSFEAHKNAEEEWTSLCANISSMTLMRHTDSWWTGTNVPGKKRQMLIYPLGIDTYEQTCKSKLANWEGIDVVYKD